MENKLIVSTSPHIHTSESVSGVMLDVIIALLPATIAGVFLFGYRAAIVVAVCIAACVFTEAGYEKIVKKDITIKDLSAVVTGLLLGLNLPVSIPLWMAAVGSVFAILVVKQFFGGLGKNFANPALAGRCFMLIAWTGAMTQFAEPFMGYGADAVSSATPLAIMGGAEGILCSLKSAFMGVKAGTIGETSGLMLIIGFIYLLCRRVVNIKIPAAYILSFAILTFLFGKNSTIMPQWQYTLMQICTGGLFLGAFFMATDYVTTPTTGKGHIIFGIGCGVLTFVIRQFCSYPEGVSFSILLMNLTTPLIERFTVPKSFGYAEQKR